MKGNHVQSLQMRILWYAVLSGIITAIVECFFILNLTMLMQLTRRNHLEWSFFRESPIAEGYRLTFLIMVGITVFLISFLLLFRNIILYVKDITNGIEQISSGYLNTVIPVCGKDEFAYIAENLNKMTQEISLLMDKEREAERTKNELITNVAHDLRTPLTSIIGYLGLLTKDSLLEEETKQKYAEIAYAKAKKLEKLIEDLFGFTKLNYGKMAMTVSKVDIVKLLNQMLDEFYPSLIEHNLEYELNTSEPGIIINADGNLLARLFDNLINNAIKYGAQGKIINIDVKQQDNEVIVSVSNYGYVIPQKELENIFMKFYRIDQSRSQNTGGTGLGLAIAKSIVEMHRGSIHASSSLKGTVFEVRLIKNLNLEDEKFGK